MDPFSACALLLAVCLWLVQWQALQLHRLFHLQEEWPQCPSVQQLQKNLGQERAAVFTFMYSTCDEVRWASCLSSVLLHLLCRVCEAQSGRIRQHGAA